VTSKLEKNVFILLTPHSYLNACELQYKLKLSKESMYIYFLTEHRESLRQINNIIDSTKWQRIRFLFGQKGRKIGKNKFFELLILIRNHIYVLYLNLFISQARRLVIGNILNPWMKFLVSRSNAKEIFILDDGNSTIPILMENRNINDKFCIPPQLKSRKNRLMFRLQNLPVRNNRLIFFTIFDQWDENHSMKKIINNLEFLKMFDGSFHKTNEVLLIGSPLADFGLITKEVFHKVLLAIQEYFTGQEVVYVRHRTESEELPGELKTISLDKPVELYLLENRILPSVVASFFSSAGINLNRIFGNQLKVFYIRIPDDYIVNPQYLSLLNVLSDYYSREEKENFRILNLDIH
jgi:hypothetical protein